ncbi:MAG: SseB family protein [Pseudomonadota bacterium]
MTDTNPLDQARAVMERSDEDRLRFYAALADAELNVLLQEEPQGEDIEPRSLVIDGQHMVLAFDSEARLAGFADGVAPYAAMPGRILAQLLGDAGLGLALNVGVPEVETILPPEALVWLTDTLTNDGPGTHDAQIRALESPGQVPDILLEALGARLTSSAGLARVAILARAELNSGETTFVLAIVGAQARAEPALARAVSEAVTFSGVEAGYLDVLFLPEGHAMVDRFARAGMQFEIPTPQAPEIAPPAPGMDPDKPPKLH